MQEGIAWTVDSGAAEPVADPEQFPGCILEPSPGSLAGQQYVGPGPGNKIPNLGQFTTQRMIANGLISNTKFQAAKVRKPLLAVSGLNDRGNPVWFDHDQTGGSFIIPKNSPELQKIRELIQQVKARVRLERKNWYLSASQLGSG